MQISLSLGGVNSTFASTSAVAPILKKKKTLFRVDVIAVVNYIEDKYNQLRVTGCSLFN
jgi:hypothetical protein